MRSKRGRKIKRKGRGAERDEEAIGQSGGRRDENKERREAQKMENGQRKEETLKKRRNKLQRT